MVTGCVRPGLTRNSISQSSLVGMALCRPVEPFVEGVPEVSVVESELWLVGVADGPEGRRPLVTFRVPRVDVLDRIDVTHFLERHDHWQIAHRSLHSNLQLTAAP